MDDLIDQLMKNNELKDGRHVVIVKHSNGFWKSTWFDVSNGTHTFPSNFLSNPIHGTTVDISHITSLKFMYIDNKWERKN